MILAKAREWSLAAAAIESTRLSAKRDVAAAATAAEIEAILSAVAWGA
jgi:hypothetical protein